MVTPRSEIAGDYICILSYYVFNGNQEADLPYGEPVWFLFGILVKGRPGVGE
jgi:hypothetical protein